MPASIEDVGPAIEEARRRRTRRVQVGGRRVQITTPFPSPRDWRDVWIYFLMVDRFDNPAAPPRFEPWDGEHGGFQGGNLAGVRARLDYLKELGAGAVWLSPVLKNCRYDEGSYHGYGIQDFLSIDPRLSSDPERARREPAFVEVEFRRLVDEAHARGLYVILDVVLNHTGDVFEYAGIGSVAPWRDDPYQIRWRDEDGTGRLGWEEPPADPHPDAAVWPVELRRNAAFRRRGNAFSRPAPVTEEAGDFFSLKELVTGLREDDRYPIADALIRAYEYVIAKFDVDGFRIDTLKFVEPEFARLFGNAMREFALSIGKRNFFTFGEVYDEEEKIARFIGRRATEPGDLIGVDAALDFPLFYRLPWVTKGMRAPTDVIEVFERRKRIQRDVIASHGEASAFFVTFLDNHDQHHRIRHVHPADPARYDQQVSLALGCLFGLQGIPCLYYGSEQGLHGAGDRPEAVREALWGKPEAFDASHPFARTCRDLSDLRARQPALRYGRQYFRAISGDGVNFGPSPYPGGVLAFSRILADLEVVVVVNTSTTDPWSGEVVVDRHLNEVGGKYAVLFANQEGPTPPAAVAERAAGDVVVREPTGGTTFGPLRSLGVALRPMEVQILARE